MRDRINMIRINKGPLYALNWEAIFFLGGGVGGSDKAE